MNQAQWIARKALMPLLLAGLASPALHATDRPSSLDPWLSEIASSQNHSIASTQPAIGAAYGNFALITQVGDSLTSSITQTGIALEAFILQSGYAHAASIEQHGSHNQGLIVQSGAYDQARIGQYGAHDYALIEQTGTGIAVASRRTARV